MASISFIPSLSEMAEIGSNGLGVPILFPVGEDGLATVTALHISIRFGLQDTSLWVEHEVYDPHTFAVLHIVPEVSKPSDDGSIIWTLKPGRYRVYGLITSQMSIPTQLVTPRQSSTCTMTPPPTVRVKIEPGVEAVIDLSESSEDDAPHVPPLVRPILEAQPPLHAPLSPLCTPSLKSLRASSLVQSRCIVHSLQKLTQMPSRKNILKRLDYDKIKTMEVEFLPPTYDGDVLFVLPAMDSSSSHSKAKSMFGMDKRYDGHIWTKTVTTTSAMSSILASGHPLVLVTFVVRILIASTLDVLIELLQIMIQSLKVSPKSPFLLEGPHLLDPLLFVRYARCPPTVRHCAVLGSSTSMEMTRVRGHAFILVITAIMLKLAIVGKVARRLMHSLRSMLNGLHKQRSVRLSWRQARTSLVSTLFVMKMIHQLYYL